MPRLALAMEVADRQARHTSPTPGSSPRPAVATPSTDAWRFALGALVLLALALAFYRLGSKSFDLDESTSVSYANYGMGDLVKVVTGGDPNMGLYHVLLRPWVIVLGDSEATARALSAVVAGIAVLVVAVLGGRLFGRMTGLVAGLLLASNQFFIQYAQTARGYELVVLLVALSSYFFVAELERPAPGNRVAYVASSALAIYAHYFAVYVLVAQLVTLVTLRRRSALTRAWITVAATIVALGLPAAVFAARAGTGRISWIKQPSLQDIRQLPIDLAGGSTPLAWVLLALALYGLVRGLGDRERWRAGFTATWLLSPVLLAFAVSFVTPMFLSYYLIVVLPALVLLAAAGLVRLPGRATRVIVLVGLVALTVPRVNHWYNRRSEEDYRGATNYIVTAARPGDDVVYYPTFVATPVSIYERHHHSHAPARLAVTLGARLPAHPPRIWLVMRVPDGGPQQQALFERSLGGGYQRVSGMPTFHRVVVALYQSS